MGVSLSPCLSLPTFVAIRKVMKCVSRSPDRTSGNGCNKSSGNGQVSWRTFKAATVVSGARIMCFENFYEVVKVHAC